MARFTAAETDIAIGKRIQLRRKELGISAEVLAEKIGVSQQQFSRYERGATKMNVNHLVDIAIILDTPIDWFFSDSKTFNLDNKQLYVPIHNDALRFRLDYHWQQMNSEQKRALINWLDAISREQ
ncbi:helix-turn-helix domain-containing protein [Rodentibacter pneumotropicus]|uniref:Transcriptional repressor DicA n=1 Tax=Rodentibacter pneumotropicus TaxID=758 RepID=A0A3S4UNX0_9PAST|nr:helix-turn-helix transcriptional regulator [Rodentibacter pneumotropicus]MDC2825350.1 helix-turn-helix transcriptional regulator [Rodentibacter pneumotropicus]NBH74616.1 XRE family transcriptional regulator [Rodentibacter pneumotropicus]OOF62450.1 transcriptional regulator [Rodentibacter pneumotropicus]OOF63174.1 transcriptional regulator [Rodentibacter pneumotropicus]THA01313.1 XRE family transcriptional regulator [Rodentibacter pneumotropicus]